MPLSNKIPFLSFDKIENIDYTYLKDLGIKGLIFDLDNTIICPNEELIPKNMIQFLKKLEKQFKIVIVTNNSKYRMETANQGNFDCVSRAQKPSRTAFLKANNILNLDKNEIAIIGDQIQTDIKLANLCGVRSILVNPIDIKTDTFFTKFNRFFEMRFLLKIKNSNPIIFEKYFKNFYNSVK